MNSARPKILVVDDTPANLVAMRHLLSGIEAQVVQARSGNEALAASLDHDFALILLDVQMPGMDGFEVASFLAEEDRTREVPIIFVTAAADELNRLRGYGHGAVDYIAKPINEDILLSKVRIFLQLYRSRQELHQANELLNLRNAQLEAEITERKRLEELARHQASHDPLTGLPNRLLFMDRINQAMERASRHQSRFGLLYIDIDGFKPVNDRLGHHAGDLLLKGIAARLLLATRKSDTCTRLGGDEFAVVLEETVESAAVLQRFGDKLCEQVRAVYALDLGQGRIESVQIGASIGAALYPDHARGTDPLQQLVRAADEAMYRAKHGGKNRCVTAD